MSGKERLKEEVDVKKEQRKWHEEMREASKRKGAGKGKDVAPAPT